MSVQAMPRAAHHRRAVRAAATAAGLPWWTTRPSRLRGITSHRRPPRPAAQIATDRPDRWVVERIFAWLQGFERLRTRWQRRADNREVFLKGGCCRTPCCHRCRPANLPRQSCARTGCPHCGGQCVDVIGPAVLQAVDEEGGRS
ncbi:transposase [Streptomyces sp. NPDC005075]